MFRLCVVGSGGVGKSSLTIRYLKNEFTEYYDPTLEETYRKEIEYNGKLYDVEIVDTAGQEEFSSFRDSSVATGDAFLVLFAINSALSWHELKELRSKIIQDRQAASAIPMVMVGNKLDLEGEREVNKDEVLEYCNSSDVNIPLIETSAKMLATVYVSEKEVRPGSDAAPDDELSAAEELCLNQFDWLERGGNIPTDDASDSADSTSTVRKDSSQKPRGQKKEK